MLSINIIATLYLVSGIFFILSLRGLSSPETSRKGNIFGMTGMFIAIISTLLGLESFEILLTNIESTKHLSLLGPEPLSSNFSFKYLKNKIRSSNSSVKNLLMNQSVVSGLGNIYVNEALFRSCVSPQRLGKFLKDIEIRKIIIAIKKVLKMAIKAGGSTIQNYHNSEGKIGSYQANFKVYEREGEICKRTGCTGKIKRIIVSGRSSFFCIKCQT